MVLQYLKLSFALAIYVLKTAGLTINLLRIHYMKALVFDRRFFFKVKDFVKIVCPHVSMFSPQQATQRYALTGSGI